MSAFLIQPDTSDRIEIEGRLTGELQAAKVALDSATAQFERVIEDCKKSRLKSHRTPDFQPAGEQGSAGELLRRHRDALVKYRQATENFNNFVLYSQLPDFLKPGSPEISMNVARIPSVCDTDSEVNFTVDSTRVSILTNPHPRHHIVYPYTDEERITNAVNAFASSGISKGESVVLILADAHHEPVKKTLRTDGFDFAALEGAGQLDWISAEGLLHRIMPNGMPDETLFKSTIGEITERARAGSPTGKVRVVGEMVGLLFSANNIAAAERMEELWNETIEASSVALLCTYALDGQHKSLPESLVRLHSHGLGSAASHA